MSGNDYNIYDLSNLVPSVEEIRRQTARPADQPASQEALQAMREYLVTCGYSETNSKVYNVILRYGAAELEHKNVRGLFLRGDCGIGKSLGIKCLAAYFKWPVIPAKLLQTAYLSAESDEQFWRIVDGLNFYGEARTIVIDDVGTEDCPVMKYGTATNVIADVLDRRYYEGFQRHGVRTIVTCNLTDAAMNDRYGVRISDRMDEMFRFATVSGQSLRQQTTNQ